MIITFCCIYKEGNHCIALDRCNDFLYLPIYLCIYYILRYLEDLYTLTYDEDSSMDQDEYESSHEKIINMKIPTGLISLQVTFNINKCTGCPQKKFL